MMKGRTTNYVQSNRSMKNGKRDQKTQKMNGAKKSSEQERLKPLEAKVSEVVSVITTRSNQDDEDVSNGSSNHYQESETSRIAEETKKDECANGSVCVLVKDDDDEGESKEFDAIANAKIDSVSFSETCDGVNVNKRATHLVKEVEDGKDTSNGGSSGGTENEAGDDVKENSEDEEILKQKVENLKTRIEKLEKELREVAAHSRAARDFILFGCTRPL